MENKGQHRKLTLYIIGLCFVCGLLGVVAGCLLLGGVEKRVEQRLTNLEAAVAETKAERPLTGVEIYELSQTQTVGIQTDYTTTNLFGISTPDAVSGTGFVIREDGYILTNYHIVEKAILHDGEISVLFPDGDRSPARVSGFEASLDLAVLKLDKTGLTAVDLGDSSALRVGDRVYTEGNNLGELAFTQTTGTISGLDRFVIATIGGEQVPLCVFQLDAAINSGSSGGPVYNERGEVVGIVTAKYAASGVEGLGFAMPINDVMKAAQELILNGYIAGMTDLGAQIADAQQGVSRASVSYVVPGGCADRAGLLVGDAITAIDGRRVSVQSELEAVIKTYRIGDTAELTVDRDGETVRVEVVFDNAEG